LFKINNIKKKKNEKKFFIRSEANNQFMDYKCNKNSNCSITTETRSLCQLCRYKKCKLFGLNIKSRLKQPSQSSRLENCLICNSESSGIHFGVLSCEGCKVCLKIFIIIIA
jgi:hypothetical protein